MVTLRILLVHIFIKFQSRLSEIWSFPALKGQYGVVVNDIAVFVLWTGTVVSVAFYLFYYL